ncbi:BamA/TamA family outer membrane protein [Pedobacter sp. AW31-3R]|uniref:BamA/TamA family outer membrane protein n=1 Tax=Pedobacter sp. AW31-3R TaxID=3445781 RepID=UPI003F9F0257
MIRKLLFFSLVLSSPVVFGQHKKDSVTVRVHPSYDQVSGVHRWLFGENYRKEWAIEVRLPLIRISDLYGGLIPEKEGGGMQSKSLRLKDKNGKEYILRTVEKTPDKLLPVNLQGTFAVDWVDDAMSGQHPFSALIVPPLARAANVPHANPIIGVVAEDAALGDFAKEFTGLVCLFEEREPAGESENTPKVIRDLVKNYNKRFDSRAFLRARLLDLLIGDWDRHEDQWRWASDKNGKEEFYIAVPRDRDQVFHLSEGLFPSIAALPWISPLLDDFEGEIPRVRFSMFKTRFMNAFPDAQLPEEEWIKIASDFVAAETDEVLEAGLRRLPEEVYRLRHDELFKKLKARRDHIPEAIKAYYRYANRIVDLRATDKNELITITDAADKGLRVVITNLNKDGEEKKDRMDMTYRAELTRELRLYLGDGEDKVLINNKASAIKLRVIGAAGNKTYQSTVPGSKARIYGTPEVVFEGEADHFRKHLSTDTLQTKYIPTNLYNVWIPTVTAAINADDGFLLGLGFKYIHNSGFRKLPYTHMQQFMLSHSFATNAFRIRYNGEWIKVLGKADFTLQAIANAPDNTLNFFGRGNESALVKEGNYRRYYRTRYNTFLIDPALRWTTGKQSTISAGPSFQYYHLDLTENGGRFINNVSQINSYDSATVTKDKAHLGLSVNFVSNKREGGLLPVKGYYLNVSLQGYTGLNHDSKSFAQLRPEFTFYQKLNSKGSVVLSDRIGGGISIGKPAFYQSMFLGGQGNLLGYLQNRFAGQHMVYNNLQARVKLFNIASYILPGQLGLTGFYDAGRVWVKGEESDKWHQGKGGGLYFSPAGLTIFQVLAGHSEEGWYPYVSLNFRI